jgi:metal-dependent amidase/aminoacylase/carboxypeptidase family protein
MVPLDLIASLKPDEPDPIESRRDIQQHPEIGFEETRTGACLAASDMWSVTFHGTCGHGGAGAHHATDTSLAAAQFIIALQTVVSRIVPAKETAEISVGSINGTARSCSPKIRDLLEPRLTEIAHAPAAVFACAAEAHHERRYPPLIPMPNRPDARPGRPPLWWGRGRWKPIPPRSPAPRISLSC